MVEPERTHHERILHHLRNATAHYEAAAKRSTDAAQSHLDSVAAALPTPPQLGDDNATQDSN